MCYINKSIELLPKVLRYHPIKFELHNEFLFLFPVIQNIYKLLIYFVNFILRFKVFWYFSHKVSFLEFILLFLFQFSDFTAIFVRVIRV